jgi:hypothetical protein
VPLEEQIVGWLHDFQPDAELRAVVLSFLQAAAGREGDDSSRRRDLDGQLQRLRDLYVMGDLTKDEYTLRRQALEEELERIGPPLDPSSSRLRRSFATSPASGRPSRSPPSGAS